MNSTATITCQGLNIEQHISYLVDKRHIVVYSIKRIDSRHLCITVHSAYCKQVVDYLREKCYNDITVEYQGRQRIAKWIARHIAIVLAIVLLIPLLVVNSCVLTDIVVDSDKDKAIVISTLDQYGISVGKWIADIDYDGIENYICHSLKLSYCMVERRGNILYISLIDNIKPDNTVDYSKRRDILADRSGTVQSITVVQGTAKVATGQRVDKGDVLIEGVRVFNDNTREDVYAIGSVIASVCVSATAYYSGFESTIVDSGNSISILIIDIARISISTEQVTFDKYTTQESSVLLYPVNIKLTYCTYYEQIEQQVAVSFADNLDKLKQIAKDKALSTAQYDVADISYAVAEGVSVTAMLTYEINIAKN